MNGFKVVTLCDQRQWHAKGKRFYPDGGLFLNMIDHMFGGYDPDVAEDGDEPVRVEVRVRIEIREVES
ncbi:MAG: hypothetical protein ABUJ92_00640 [Desulfobacterales bacterium]